ncbi:GNAT family N-acetyltransferase [Streptomyces sp. NPDC050145]|uniref:GNAT family N-acetyltransferase n=1 Tax=Streptomyces sp. NPDC050145 TaxID=3365602 RepID=UPI0037A339D8
MRTVWEGLAGTPVTFAPQGGVNVVVSPNSSLCPAGWVGMVALGGSVIVTAPSESAAATVRRALARLPLERVLDGVSVREAMPVTRVLGPAALSYVTEEGFRPATAAEAVPAVLELEPHHPELIRLEERAGADDAREAALDEITSPVFVVREGGESVAAAGYRAWPGRTAHLGVLTAPAARGRGLARATASAAVAHALAAGLLPQWRARALASRRVAAALGFEELGRQLSVALAGP